MMSPMHLIAAVSLLALVSACATTPPPDPRALQNAAVNQIAERYIANVLALGEHDAHYVDAYYGPESRREAVRATKSALTEIVADARLQVLRLDGLLHDRAPAMERLRHGYLRRQLQALIVRAEQLQGRKQAFDAEAQALYDIAPPQHSKSELLVRLDELEALLPPGAGTLAERYNAYVERYAIPRDQLEPVMRAAIEEARRRTQEQIPLPPGERFELALVEGKSWSAYNWYQGGFHSRIEINTDLPVTVSRAIELAVHEGYPGHHVYNALLEQKLVRERGWPEFSVYPLFTPQSLIAEGTADYAVALAFPLEERVRFVRDTLFPLAGFDPAEAERYVAISEAGRGTGAATIEAARRYLDGTADVEATVAWLQRYALATEARARQRVKFFDDYRAYIVNYSLGERLVTDYMARVAGDDVAQRWNEFAALLASPRLPSDLRPD